MMARLSLLMLAMLIGCALALVTSQHRSRKLYVELQKEQELAKQLDVEWGQLQLEQSTWATNQRVESIASKQLGMRLPDPATIVRAAPTSSSAASASAISGRSEIAACSRSLTSSSAG